MRRAVLLLLLCAAAAGAPWVSAASGAPPLARQWALQALGAEDAWRQATGEGVTVAVLDTGADLAHPDLAPNLWTNPGEIPGNGRDDDGDDLVDADGHATRVAGVLAARSDDGVGVAGVAPRARLMVARVPDDHRNGVTGPSRDDRRIGGQRRPQPRLDAVIPGLLPGGGRDRGRAAPARPSRISASRSTCSPPATTC